MALRVGRRSGNEYISISTSVIIGSYDFYRMQVGTDVRLVIMFVICLIIFGMSAGVEIVQILFGRPCG